MVTERGKMPWPVEQATPAESPRRDWSTGLRRPLIRRAAVLGAGTMGSQIAGLLAGIGIPCDLLDLPAQDSRNRLADQGRERLKSLKPPPLYTPAALELINPGNFEDDLVRLSQVDWVIEAVAEDLGIKRQVWERVASHLMPEVIVSTNTSGITIASIAQALPIELRSRFLGTHFFNPPRYLRLLELVPGPDTDPALLQGFRLFAERVLGKGVVVTRDTPYFIANRLGIHGMLVTMQAMEEFGLGPDEVDSITGPAIARPNSATFRTLDLVGLDVALAVCDNLRSVIADPGEQAMFESPTYLRELAQRGWTGEKTGKGFYERTQGQEGETQIMALIPNTMDYRPRRSAQAPSLMAVRDMEDPGERLRMMAWSDDVAGRFAWRVLSQTLAYSAAKVDEIADDIASIDRAMRWGFGWDLGPFEVWDVLGPAKVAERLSADGLPVPRWASDLAESNQSFYRREAQLSYQATPGRTYAPVPPLAGDRFSVQELRTGPKIVEKAGATLYDLGEGVAFLDFHSPKQAIGQDMIGLLAEAARRVPESFRGLVIGSHLRPNFCVGANLMLLLLAAQDGEWQELEALVRRFQHGLLQLQRLPVPVVVATHGMVLGGGAELVLASHRTVAAAESYIGLVEVGAGFVPAGGGCKEMLRKALEATGMVGGAPRDGAPSLMPPPDPTPELAKAFETIALARVSGSAYEARQMGFLGPSDVITANLDHALETARRTVIEMDEQGYTQTPPKRLPVLGAGPRALLELAAQHQAWAGYASEHDLLIARKLAFVLTGGNRPAGTAADEEYFLDLEREAFLSLCGEPKTQARMQHLLRTGRPLRN